MQCDLNILAASDWSFAGHPFLSPWLLVPIFVAAGALVLYLYRAQQRIASRRLIVALTVIRCLLLLCMLVLLLEPVVQWRQTSKSGGTLWLLLDASRSMGVADAQGTPVEKLRWASAMGLLPKDAGKPDLDRRVAALECLRDDFAAMRAAAPQGAESAADESSRVAEFIDAVKAWEAQLNTVTGDLVKDARAKSANPPVLKPLQDASRVLDGGLAHAGAWKDVQAAAKELLIPAVTKDLNDAIKTLAPLADAADAEFLAKHASEKPVQAALEQAGKLTRAELAARGLNDKSPSAARSFPDVLAGYHVRLASFADKAQAAASVDSSELPGTIRHALSPGGGATNLAAGLQLIAEQVGSDISAGRESEPTSVLIVSDGKQNTEGDAAAIAHQLAGRGVRVFALALGSRKAVVDAAVESPQAPSWVNKGDTVTAGAAVRLSGLSGRKVPVEFRRDGVLVKTQTIDVKKDEQTEKLTFQDDKPAAPGLHEYDVRVPEQPGELTAANNTETFRVAVNERQLAVLIVDDQPRWEYRHLVSYLSRDKGVKLQTVLLQPGKIGDVTPPPPVKASPRNTQQESQILPETKEEWQAFDLVILGDVPRISLAERDQRLLAEAIKERGTTLIAIAGQRAMPAAYLNTPLAEVLPVQLGSAWDERLVMEHLKTGFKPAIAPEGAGSVLAQFSAEPETNAELWTTMPPWYWHSEQTQAKPSAKVLWSIGEADATAFDPTDAGPLSAPRRRALLCTASYGLGRVMYLASDQTWRLRQVNGQNLQDQFWGQVIRWAAGSELPAGGKLVRFGTDKPRYGEGEEAIVTARLLRSDLTPLTGEKFEAVVRLIPRRAEPATQPATQSAVVPVDEGRIIARTPMVESPGAPGYYTAHLPNLPAGTLEFSVAGAEVEAMLAADKQVLEKTLELKVQPHPDQEMANPNADRRFLADLTAAGRGTVLDGAYADVLAQHLPRPETEHTTLMQAGFFADPKNPGTRKTHWIFLFVFVGLITAEWVLRKLGGLV